MSTVALADCEIVRPPGFDQAVEIVRAAVATRAFPTRVSEGLGVCLKIGDDHAVVADGRTVVYPAGSLCVRAPGCVWSSDTGAAAFLSIDVAASLLPEGHGLRGMQFLPPWSLDLRALDRGLTSGDAHAREEALTELVAWAIHLHEPDDLSGSGARMPAAVRRAIEVLKSVERDTLGLEDLAREVGANRYVLIRQFRKVTGTTPHRYRLLARVEHARTMLARGGVPVEVATRLGFSDQAHFTRVFKRIVGVTPSAYARRVRRAIAVPA